MFSSQLEQLKTRLIAEKKGTAKEIDQSLQLTQKETQLKQSRKDAA